jgi:hypothetical protein
MIFFKFLLQIPLIVLALYGAEYLSGYSHWVPLLITFVALVAYTTGESLDE